MLMELQGVCKSQTQGHHTGQIDYTEHKMWHCGLPDRMNFRDRLCMVTLHMNSPPAQLMLQSVEVLSIVLADAWRLFYRMLQRDAEFQGLRSVSPEQSTVKSDCVRVLQRAWAPSIISIFFKYCTSLPIKLEVYKLKF